MGDRTKAFLAALEDMVAAGVRYSLGAEVRLPITHWPPHLIDCSEAVQVALYRCGLRVVSDDQGRKTFVTDFDGAWRQYERCHHIPVGDAIHTPGALLFSQNNRRNPYRIGHVAVSCGDGTIIEASASKGCMVHRKCQASRFTLAGKVRELYP